MNEDIDFANSIAVRLIGGLGNQLFQFAAARSLSLKLGCPLLLDRQMLEQQDPNAVAYRSYALDDFTINATPIDRRYNWKEYHQPAYYYDVEFFNLGINTRLNGFFQSELYFSEFREEIASELKQKGLASAAFQHYENIINNSKFPVSVHVRRGDFIKDQWTFDRFGVCELPYYRKAMNIIRALNGAQPDYFVFSDDYDASYLMFRELENVTFVKAENSSPSEDLFLMSRCHSHIQANSSFSWWASYLNQKYDKVTIAPRNWVSRAMSRTLNTVDLYAEGTIII